MQSGLSTLGITFSYAVEEEAGTKPSAFTLIIRVNAIGGIELSTENIDSSALEDLVSRYVPGRDDSGGTFPVTINLTSETAAEWKTIIQAYKTAQEGGSAKGMWFQVAHPSMAQSFFIVAAPPSQIPMPSSDQNSLWTVEMTLTIDEYKGLDTKVTAA